MTKKHKKTLVRKGKRFLFANYLIYIGLALRRKFFIAVGGG